MGVIANHEYSSFLETHRPQLETSCIPEHFWPVLFDKLKNEYFDAGTSFIFTFEESEDEEEDENEIIQNGHSVDSINGNGDYGSCQLTVSREEGIRKDDHTQIYLIDHAWSFRPNAVQSTLRTHESLNQRLANLLNIPEASVEKVAEKIWTLAQSYSLNATDAEGAVPIWYIMDELGSRIAHSDTPNFRLVPIYFHDRSVTYSVMFPIEDVQFGDRVTRNFIEGPPKDLKTTKALLLPWHDCDFLEEDFNQEEPEEQFFLSGRHLESMPTNPPVTEELDSIDKNRRLKVYTEYLVLQDNLSKDGRYQITNNFEEADIIWLNTHFKDFETLKQEYPEKMINQFPFEHILTVKDLFAVVSRRDAPHANGLTTFPEWLPTSFNMMTELPKFVGYFQRREGAGLDNYWIVKPFNLARSLDTYITNNLAFIMRLATSGPKMVCKYITDPVLFRRPEIGKVKFDVRYCVLLQSANPLRLLVHRKFYLRFANEPFSLDSFEVYQKHFTVMNYSDDATMKNLLCDDFVVEFEQQNNIKWESVESKIFDSFRQLFRNAVKLPPPRGIGHNPQSRSMYAIDLMLQWKNGEIQPQLLELNWAPDCKRACEFYPTFFGDVFDSLFKNDLSSGNVIRLL